MSTILKALATLTRLNYNIRSQDYRAGLANVCQLTGLMGRWQKEMCIRDSLCSLLILWQPAIGALYAVYMIPFAFLIIGLFRVMLSFELKNLHKRK